MSKSKKITTRKTNPIENVMATVNQELGANTVNRISDKGASIPLTGVWSTQLETVDMAWGRGGVPRGRIVVLHGKEGSGKTTIALTIGGSAQRDGAIVLYIDAEFKLDLGWCPKCGLDPDDIILSQPDYLEQAMGIIDATMKAAKANGLSVYAVLDSMNACDTKAEHESDWDTEIHYGPKAKVYSRTLPKLVRTIRDTNSNHIACGNAPKFYASCIGQFSKPQGHRVMTGSNVTATLLEVEWIKNQVAAPYKKGLFRITGDGPDTDWAMLEAAAARGLISKGNAGWLELGRPKGDPLKFQGVKGWRKILEKRPELADELLDKVRAPYNVVT
jgi:recombination protein RecA